MNKNNFIVWIFQTGEQIHTDGENIRGMRAINLSNYFLEKGYKVVLWTSAFNHQNKTHRSHIYQSLIFSSLLEIRLIPSSGYKKNISIKRLFDHYLLGKNLRRKLHQEESMPNLSIIGYPPIEFAYEASKFLKERGVPYYLDVKDQWPVIITNIFPKIIQPFIKIIMGGMYMKSIFSMKNALGISTMSNEFLSWTSLFSNRNISENDIVLPLGSKKLSPSDIDIKKAEISLISKKISILKDKKRFYFVGNHSMKIYDFKTVITVFKQLESIGTIELVIAGIGDATQHWKKMADGAKNIKFIGYIDQAEHAVLAKHSLATISPYKNTEDFKMSIPNKIVDSLMLNKPIITCLEGSVKDLIDEYRVGEFYPEGNCTRLTEIIIEYSNNTKNVETCNLNCKNLYSKKFDYENCMNKFFNQIELTVLSKNANQAQ